MENKKQINNGKNCETGCHYAKECEYRTEEEYEEREKADKGTQGDFEKARAESGQLAGGEKSAGQHSCCEPAVAPFREETGL